MKKNLFLHTVFNQKFCLPIMVMNYSNYIFNKIFKMLANTVLRSELFFFPTVYTTHRCYSVQKQNNKLRFMNKIVWINIYLYIIYSTAIMWCFSWHLFNILLEVDVLLNSLYVRSDWNGNIFCISNRLVFSLLLFAHPV